jgi:hypothetical protein
LKDVAQVVEHLPNKCKVLSSNPSIVKKYIKKPIKQTGKELTAFMFSNIPESRNVATTKSIKETSVKVF